MPQTRHLILESGTWIDAVGTVAVPNPYPGGEGRTMLLDAGDAIASWSAPELEAVGIYPTSIPDPAPGQVAEQPPTFSTGPDGRPVVETHYVTAYPDLTSGQFAGFFEASGLSVPWLAAEADQDGPRQLLQTERTTAPFDLASVLEVREYLADAGQASVPTEQALRDAWLAAMVVPSPVPDDAPWDADTSYAKGAVVTHDSRRWKYLLPYAMPGVEPGLPQNWAVWKDEGAIEAGIEEWTQRTAGNYMYGVDVPEAHPAGSAAIGTLHVSFGGNVYLLVHPDNWGFDPPTSIASIPNPAVCPWQLVGPL